MKKIFIITVSVIMGLFSPIFALSLNEKLDIIFTKKIDSKIEHKYQSKQKVCKAKKLIYNKLITRLKTIKKEKYQKLIKIVINFTENRKKNIEECKITIKHINHNILSKNPILHFQIDTSYINKNNFNINYRTNFQNKNLDIVSYADKVYSQRYFQINNKWYVLSKWSYSYVEKIDNNIIKYFKEKYPNKKFIIARKNWTYTVYIYDNSNIYNIWDINPSKPLDPNTLSKMWIYYLDNFIYSKKSEKWDFIAWITKLQNNLVYVITARKTNYYLIKNRDDVYALLATHNDIKYITKDKNGYKLWIKGSIWIYDLWNYNMYKNIDIKKMWELLFPSFFRVITNNTNYSTTDMYYIINLAKKFDNKNLENLYRFISTNYKYSDIISKKLKENITDSKLNEIAISDPKLSNLWNLFYTSKNKVAVCQTLSELLSIISLFNWQKIEIIIWHIWYSHQISKINNFYYDVTWDLWKNKWFRYFGMTKKETEKYFTFDN